MINITIRRVYAMDPGGIWHIADQTYRSHCDAACGRKQLRVVTFTTEEPPRINGYVCALCRLAAATVPEPWERAG